MRFIADPDRSTCCVVVGVRDNTCNFNLPRRFETKDDFGENDDDLDPNPRVRPGGQSNNQDGGNDVQDATDQYKGARDPQDWLLVLGPIHLEPAEVIEVETEHLADDVLARCRDLEATVLGGPCAVELHLGLALAARNLGQDDGPEPQADADGLHGDQQPGRAVGAVLDGQEGLGGVKGEVDDRSHQQPRMVVLSQAHSRRTPPRLEPGLDHVRLGRVVVDNKAGRVPLRRTRGDVAKFGHEPVDVFVVRVRQLGHCVAVELEAPQEDAQLQLGQHSASADAGHDERRGKDAARDQLDVLHLARQDWEQGED